MATLPRSGGWSSMIFEVPSNPIHRLTERLGLEGTSKINKLNEFKLSCIFWESSTYSVTVLNLKELQHQSLQGFNSIGAPSFCRYTLSKQLNQKPTKACGKFSFIISSNQQHCAAEAGDLSLWLSNSTSLGST